MTGDPAETGPAVARIVVVATRNAHKLREIREILTGLDLELRSLDAFADVPEVEEDGDTFRANAVKKAAVVAAATGHVVLADDSGLVVPDLGGAPGVRSARYAGEDATDAGNRARLHAEIARAGLERPRAHFRCAIVLVDPSGAVVAEADERCEGRIVTPDRGGGGFGYDPMFLDEELGRTFAEVPAEEKNARSHRGRALRALRGRLADLRRAGGAAADHP